MTVNQTQLFDPPVRTNAVDGNGNLARPLRQWLFSVQNLHPLITVDTTEGNVVQAVPPAGLNSSTGQSNQNMEITYVKSSADGNTVSITGVEGGTITLTAQYQSQKIKSDGTNWWKTAA
jgi:hypothetical protein